MTPVMLERLLAATRAGRPVVLATRLADGAQYLLPEDAAEAGPALAEAAAAALAADQPALQEGWFLHPHNPPLRLFIVGAVHIAQAMLPMAAALGYAVTVIDPRRAFATAERLPGVAIRHDWPDEALAELAPDARSAVVTLTHDPKIDDPALVAALNSPAFYVGALGSTRTHAKRLARLREAGLSEAALARIHAPVGLDIKAVTAPEIALSIMAEIVATRRGSGLARRG
ncbi:MAG: XdhC family protein [Rhodovarius sp.]|nr:XdhC family protein [Rhodovarius sp.]MCX7931559.1 XdhC family protein [Rhodovarius sp.]MDW8314867.1 XdhC family protein [Rhodovarius sp.]